MSLEDVDPSLLQDFLTESGELIEQLDADMVSMETASAADLPELLNGTFRALHTIKGAASFLGIEPVIRFAHAAEDALNRLRKGDLALTAEIMDAMLRAVDVVRGQIDEMNQGQEPSPGPEDLIQTLHGIAAGKSPGSDDDAGSVADEAPAQTVSVEAEVAAENGGEEGGADWVAMVLPPQKVDLLEFMVADLREQSQNITQCLAEAGNDATRQEAVQSLSEITDGLIKTLEFFELDDLKGLVEAIHQATPRLADLDHAMLEQLSGRILACQWLLEEQGKALDDSRRLIRPVATMVERITEIAQGRTLEADQLGRSGRDALAWLVLDGVFPDTDVPSDTGTEVTDLTDTVASIVATLDPTEGVLAASAGIEAEGSDAGNDTGSKAGKAAGRGGGAEATIRVEVGRLEDLLNLVGQMVLAKNRLLALGRQVRDFEVPHDLCETITAANSDLDRLTGELQVSVMRTRMQPLAKLFDRYPRVIRDLARMTDKKIDLEIVGKETEVDKSVLELLADPLVHILRNSADHGVEVPAARAEKGKPELGRIRLAAEHQGSHVRIAVEDDGKGLDREVIARKVVERGLSTAEAVAQMSDSDVFRFILAAGFSTADKVSDLSGRGVGMDVVNTNVVRMNGQINIESKKGVGTTIEILIPLTVAIMPAMMVGIGNQLYAIPLQSIVEIVRPEPELRYTINAHPVMRLRDSVLPLVDMRSRLDEIGQGESRFAVVVGVGGQRAGLMVDRLIGQQEVVIKPLDDGYTQGGPFSGATIREDGDVSLILDVVQLIRNAQAQVAGVEPEEDARTPERMAA